MKKNKRTLGAGGFTKGEINLMKAVKSLLDVGSDVFPQKKFEGGPLVTSAPPSDTIVSPVRLDVSAPELTMAQRTDNQMRIESAQLLNAIANGTMKMSDLPITDRRSNKVKSKDRYREKSYGGDAAMTEASEEAQGLNVVGNVFKSVPIIGDVASGLVSGIGSAMQQSTKDKFSYIEPMRINNNIYGNQAMGGMVTNKFKQYDTGSHQSGNDLAIDVNGNGNQNASGGYIQNQENAYTFPDQSTYIMSDTLVNPETGNLFNQDAAKINKTYSKADMIPEEKNAMDFEMNRLSKLNDTMRNLKEQVLKACGGKTHEDGGPVDPRFGYQVNNETTPLETINEDLPYLTDNPFVNSIPTFTQIPQDTAIDNTNPISNQSIGLGTNLSNTPSQDRNANSEVNSQTKKSDFNYNTVALGLKGIALGKSIADALTPAEKEKPILPNYNKADDQMYKANIDYTQARQDAVAASNMASQVNRSASSNFAAYQGRQGMNFANLSDQISRISEAENNQRSQLALTRSQYEANKSVDKANRLYQNRVDNLQNQAVSDYADQKLFTELSQIGSEFNNYQYYKDALKNNKELTELKVKEAAAIIGNKYDNFGFSKEFMDKVSKGDYENLDFNEVIKFISTAQSVKSTKG